MNEIVLTTGVVVFILYAIVRIAYLVDMWRTGRVLRRLISETDKDLQQALSALKNIFEDIGKATYNIVAATERVRDLAERAAAVENRISDFYENYKETAGDAARAQAAGLKAGILAGVSTLLKTLNEKKEGSS